MLIGMKLLLKYFFLVSAVGAVLSGGCLSPQKELANRQPQPQLVRFFSITQVKLKPGSLFVYGKGSAAADGGKNTFTAKSSLSSYPLIRMTIKSDDTGELNSCLQRVPLL
jgi:hypothetical protein